MRGGRCIMDDLYAGRSFFTAEARRKRVCRGRKCEREAAGVKGEARKERKNGAA